MTVIAIALVGALVAGLVAGGRRSRLFNPPFARTGYLMLVVLSQISAMLSQHVSVMIMWLTLGVLGAVVYWRANRTRPGLLLIIAGLALNAFVVIINLGQPISVAAAQRAGLDVTAASLATDPRALPIDHETLLPWLGQVIAVPIPHWSSVASPGDIIVAGGVAVFLFTGLTGFGRKTPKTPLEERSERRAARAAKRDKRAAADSGLEGQIIESTEAAPRPAALDPATLDPATLVGAAVTGAAEVGQATAVARSAGLGARAAVADSPPSAAAAEPESMALDADRAREQRERHQKNEQRENEGRDRRSAEAPARGAVDEVPPRRLSESGATERTPADAALEEAQRKAKRARNQAKKARNQAKKTRLQAEMQQRQQASPEQPEQPEQPEAESGATERTPADAALEEAQRKAKRARNQAKKARNQAKKALVRAEMQQRQQESAEQPEQPEVEARPGRTPEPGPPRDDSEHSDAPGDDRRGESPVVDDLLAAVAAAAGPDAQIGEVARAPDPTESIDTSVWRDRATAHLPVSEDPVRTPGP